MVAEVIVDIAHSEVDRVFDYLCGDEVCAGMARHRSLCKERDDGDRHARQRRERTPARKIKACSARFGRVARPQRRVPCACRKAREALPLPEGARAAALSARRNAHGKGLRALEVGRLL